MCPQILESNQATSAFAILPNSRGTITSKKFNYLSEHPPFADAHCLLFGSRGELLAERSNITPRCFRFVPNAPIIFFCKFLKKERRNINEKTLLVTNSKGEYAILVYILPPDQSQNYLRLSQINYTTNARTMNLNEFSSFEIKQNSSLSKVDFNTVNIVDVVNNTDSSLYFAININNRSHLIKRNTLGQFQDELQCQYTIKKILNIKEYIILITNTNILQIYDIRFIYTYTITLDQIMITGVECNDDRHFITLDEQNNIYLWDSDQIKELIPKRIKPPLEDNHRIPDPIFSPIRKLNTGLENFLQDPICSMSDDDRCLLIVGKGNQNFLLLYYMTQGLLGEWTQRRLNSPFAPGNHIVNAQIAPNGSFAVFAVNHGIHTEIIKYTTAELMGNVGHANYVQIRSELYVPRPATPPQAAEIPPRPATPPQAAEIPPRPATPPHPLSPPSLIQPATAIQSVPSTPTILTATPATLTPWFATAAGEQIAYAPKTQELVILIRKELKEKITEQLDPEKNGNIFEKITNFVANREKNRLPREALNDPKLEAYYLVFQANLYMNYQACCVLSTRLVTPTDPSNYGLVLSMIVSALSATNISGIGLASVLQKIYTTVHLERHVNRLKIVADLRQKIRLNRNNTSMEAFFEKIAYRLIENPKIQQNILAKSTAQPSTHNLQEKIAWAIRQINNEQLEEPIPTLAKEHVKNLLANLMLGRYGHSILEEDAAINKLVKLVVDPFILENPLLIIHVYLATKKNEHRYFHSASNDHAYEDRYQDFLGLLKTLQKQPTQTAINSYLHQPLRNTFDRHWHHRYKDHLTQLALLPEQKLPEIFQEYCAFLKKALELSWEGRSVNIIEDIEKLQATLVKDLQLEYKISIV